MKNTIIMKSIAITFILFAVPFATAVRAKTLGAAEKNSSNSGGTIVYGKYGCISTAGSVARGTCQIHTRGSFVITAGGKYASYGYEKPIKGGALGGGEATPLGEGYENQF